MNNFYCFVIPCYNHHQVLSETLEHLRKYQMAVILVDDGSNTETKAVLQQVSEHFDFVTLLTRKQNGGKGAAVHSGLTKAHELGYTHALQIDADGQHNFSDIDDMLRQSQQHPQALISGNPVYDDSISKGRYYGRFITHFWVYIETLSFAIKDTMCGFRVYPLAAYVALTNKVQLGTRMDYDIEVMVRLYWQGVRVLFVDTKVRYPKGGISHFNVWQDNMLISKMHTKLFFGMLVRLPVLLFRKFSRS